MFYLTPQERKFMVLVMIVFITGAALQLLLRRDIAPMRWFKQARHFKIDINTARVDQLQMLPGIGAGLAARVDSRSCLRAPSHVASHRSENSAPSGILALLLRLQDGFKLLNVGQI